MHAATTPPSPGLRRRMPGFVVALLVLAILACAVPSGAVPQAVNTLPPPAPATPIAQLQPTQAQPTQGTTSSGTGGKTPSVPPQTNDTGTSPSQPNKPQQPPAQPVAPSQPEAELEFASPTFGTLSLVTGFQSDPASVAVVSGGDVDVSYLGGDCYGFAAGPPDVTLQWDGFGFLRIFFVADGGGDTTLVVNDANGGWHCSDDSYDTLNPTVDIGDAASGQIDIWIPSFEPGDFLPGTLYVTELDYHPGSLPGQQQPPAQQGTGLQFGDPTYGTLLLVTGFTPDPATVSVISGGDVDTSYLGGDCYGYAAVNPDVRLQWEGFGFLRIFFVADDGSDTTLVINDSNANWHCNDDAPGTFDPAVDFADAQDGQYDIWVASFDSGDFISGTLYITELGSYSPTSLP